MGNIGGKNCFFSTSPPTPLVILAYKIYSIVPAFTATALGTIPGYTFHEEV